MKKVIIYARVSTKDQELNNQLDKLKKFCKSSKYNISEIITDKMSGLKSDRPGFKKIFERASRREFDLLLFWSLDRFSREGMKETLMYLYQLEKCGVQFKSFMEPYIDSTSMFKDVVIGILSTIANFESKRKSENIRAGLDYVKKKGQKLGRPGVDQETIKKIIKLRLSGANNSDIARKLGVNEKTVRNYKDLTLSQLNNGQQDMIEMIFKKKKPYKHTS